MKRSSFIAIVFLTAAVASAQTAGQTTPTPAPTQQPMPPPPTVQPPTTQQQPTTPAPAAPGQMSSTPTQVPAGGQQTSPAGLGGSAPTMSTSTGPAPLQVTDENRAMIMMLLDRIQKVTADQMGQDSKAGKLQIDRAKLDEILASVSQVKTMLQR